MSGDSLYTLDDPRPIAAEAPYTYFLPSAAELAAIEPGDVVQLVFRGLAPGLKWGAERMWVTVTSADGDDMTGRLENQPNDLPGLEPGAIVVFNRFHAIDVSWSEARESPPPARLVKRWFWDRCLVDLCVIEEGLPVHFLYREEPEPLENDTEPDSGWRIRGDYRNVSDEELEARRVDFIALGKVLNVDDSWLHLIDYPIGSAFIRNWETGEFEPEQ